MGRWVAALLALLAVGLLAARWLAVPVRDSWVVVGALPDTSFLYVRFTVGNTGLFADQQVTRVALVRPQTNSLEHRAIVGPARLDDAGVHGALDHLERSDDAWTWTVDGTALRTRGRLEPGGSEGDDTVGDAGCPPSPGALTGLLDVPSVSAAAADGALLDGVGLTLRTQAVGEVRGAALYALSPEGGLVVDPLADCPAWIRVGERGWSGELPMLPWSAGEDFELSLGGERLHVQLSPRSLEQRALTGTLWGERLLARVVGYGSPVVTLTRARVTVRGQGHAWTGLYLRRDTD